MPRPSRFRLINLQSGLALLIIVLLAVITSPRSAAGDRIFLEAGNLTDILRQVSEIGIMAVGMTLVILTAGIDLSVGSTLALATSLVGLCLTRWTPAIGTSPLAIGRVELAGGEQVSGFVCEGFAAAGARDISDYGGWRAFIEQGVR